MSKVSAVQMASGPSVHANLLEAQRLIARAAENGAQLVVLPENFALMGSTEQDKVAAREADGAGQIQDFLATEAQRQKVWLVGGTVPMACDDPARVRAACLVYDANGDRVARYDKMHLFDVCLQDGKETYNESETIEAGHDTVVIDTPFGRLGLAVCYDLRFPELFRSLLQQGMELCAIPSAFTAVTGKAHWEVLVRARAIENFSYMIAAAQGGYHHSGRETYGDSMVVDPWGLVQDRLPRGAGIVYGDINRPALLNTRRNFPSIEHVRLACRTD